MLPTSFGGGGCVYATTDGGDGTDGVRDGKWCGPTSCWREKEG